NSVCVSFTEENIFPRIWRRLISRLQIEDFSDLTKQAQSYNFENISTMNFYTHEISEAKSGISVDKHSRIDDYRIKYFLSEVEKKEFSISLSLKYGLNYRDVSTKINNPYLYSLFITGKPKGPITVEN